MTPPTTDEMLLAAMDLGPDEQIGWRNVSQTQLSLARYSGGMTVNGRHYTYFPADDTLWRDDVVAAVKAMRKREDALERMAEDAKQMGLDY